jgi:hypothetical protein
LACSFRALLPPAAPQHNALAEVATLGPRLAVMEYLKTVAGTH